jgi:hypothetical protein
MERLGVIEQRIELEPRAAVVTRFHLEMAASFRKQRRNGFRHGASMRSPRLIASCDRGIAGVEQH